MRIGTWNLAGRWTDAHAALLAGLDCDVLLLTEVSERLDLHGYHQHPTEARMAAKRHWSAVLSRAELDPLADPHFATAAARVVGVRFVSSILPWRGCGERWPGVNTHERTTLAVRQIARSADGSPLVWGGDWNHSLSGREYAGSKAGRADIQRTVETLDLQVPTAALGHPIAGVLSIDHVAVPASWSITSADRVLAVDGAGKRLCDHDAYVVETERTAGV
jgi:hypothetical protein